MKLNSRNQAALPKLAFLTLEGLPKTLKGVSKTKTIVHYKIKGFSRKSQVARTKG